MHAAVVFKYILYCLNISGNPSTVDKDATVVIEGQLILRMPRC
jgi:hypothetical protein